MAGTASPAKMLVPVTENPPAKVRDTGVVALVKGGMAAFNAKSGELLFLPLAQARARELAAHIGASLFEGCGAQEVGCGSDDAIRSLAERYVREWGDAATLYMDARGREIRILGWSEDAAGAQKRSAKVREDILALLNNASPEMKLAFVQEIAEDKTERHLLLSPASAGAIGGQNGFVCQACGRLLLPDSPYGFTPPQPGANEGEEPLTDIETPGANTILGLCELLNIDIAYTLKAMLYVAVDASGKPHPAAAFVRGDYNVSMPKLAAWLSTNAGLHGLRTAEKSELQEMIGEVAGYCGPVRLPESVAVVCDESVRGSKNTVVGANRTGYHRKGCCHGRDFDAPLADIAQVSAGIACPCGAGVLEEAVLRECGFVENGVTQDVKPLSYRDRDGAHEYPAELRGNISIEMLILAEHS